MYLNAVPVCYSVYMKSSTVSANKEHLDIHETYCTTCRATALAVPVGLWRNSWLAQVVAFK